MPKLYFQIVVFSLLPSLLIDPAFASAVLAEKTGLQKKSVFVSQALALRTMASPKPAHDIASALRSQYGFPVQGLIQQVAEGHLLIIEAAFRSGLDIGLIDTYVRQLKPVIVAMATPRPDTLDMKQRLNDIAAAFPDNREIQARVEQVQRTWQQISHKVKPEAQKDGILRRAFATGSATDLQKMPPYYVLDTLKQAAVYLVNRYKAPIISLNGNDLLSDTETDFGKALQGFSSSSGPGLLPVPYSILEKTPDRIRGHIGLVHYWDPYDGPATVMGELTGKDNVLEVKPKSTQGERVFAVSVTVNRRSNERTGQSVVIAMSSLQSVFLVHPISPSTIETNRLALESSDDLTAAHAAEDLAVMAKYDPELKPRVEKIFEDFVFHGKTGQNLLLLAQETMPDWERFPSSQTQLLLDDPAVMSRFLLIAGALRKAYPFSGSMHQGMASPMIVARRTGEVWNLGRLRLVMGSASFRRLIGYEESAAQTVISRPVGRRAPDLAAFLKAATSGTLAQITWTDPSGQSWVERGLPQLAIEYPRDAIQREELQILRMMHGLEEGPVNSPADMAFSVFRLINEAGKVITIPTAQITEVQYIESPREVFQVKFPGEEADRDVIWNTHYYLAKEFHEDFGHDPQGSTMVEPLWMRTYVGQQTMFRRSMTFTPENPLTVVAFRYHEGIRFRHLTSDQRDFPNWMLLQYFLSESHESFDDYSESLYIDILAAMLTMVLRLHEKGRVGHTEEMTDLHLENFMIPFPFYTVPPGIYNVGDLGAMNEPDELTPEMRRQETAGLQAQYGFFQILDRPSREKAYERAMATMGAATDETFKQRIRHELNIEGPAASLPGVILQSVVVGFGLNPQTWAPRIQRAIRFGMWAEIVAVGALAMALLLHFMDPPWAMRAGWIALFYGLLHLPFIFYTHWKTNAERHSGIFIVAGLFGGYGIAFLTATLLSPWFLILLLPIGIGQFLFDSKHLASLDVHENQELREAFERMQKRLSKHFSSDDVLIIADAIVKTIERGMPTASMDQIHRAVLLHFRNTYPLTAWQLYKESFMVLGSATMGLLCILSLVAGQFLLPGFLCALAVTILFSRVISLRHAKNWGMRTGWKRRKMLISPHSNDPAWTTSHEVGHYLFSSHLQETIAKLRHYEINYVENLGPIDQGPISSRAVGIYTLPIKDIQNSLQKLAKRHAKSIYGWRRWFFTPIEPAWSYDYGQLLADVIYELSGSRILREFDATVMAGKFGLFKREILDLSDGPIRQAFATVFLVGKGASLADALTQSPEVVEIWNRRPPIPQSVYTAA